MQGSLDLVLLVGKRDIISLILLQSYIACRELSGSQDSQALKSEKLTFRFYLSTARRTLPDNVQLSPENVLPNCFDNNAELSLDILGCQGFFIFVVEMLAPSPPPFVIAESFKTALWYTSFLPSFLKEMPVTEGYKKNGKTRTGDGTNKFTT
ncbi:hypothetical protein NQ317_003581 [Molorchus minor]|uniref:Uncharacterized protein n=1 Tax=Molorchus minor TaxID=1323400 RepID=A0ABQ9JEQ8_9CUCU|nr:hypothetical protein NQ317_003581 [Molorchus minor]